jgi:hypothetical protein
MIAILRVFLSVSAVVRKIKFRWRKRLRHQCKFSLPTVGRAVSLASAACDQFFLTIRASALQFSLVPGGKP